jgi:acylphosphatase
MSERVCKHFYVSGKVQGVWFRASTKEKADQLQITGWARNLPDGRVEVLACGTREKIAVLHEWLQQGPKLAKVTDLIAEEMDWQEHIQFETL